MSETPRPVLERALQQLPALQRRAVALSRIAGLAPADVALVLGLHETECRELLRRAMARMAVILGREEEGA